MNRKTCVTKIDGRGERALTANISTIAVDREGDVLLPSGIDVSEYKANPVVLLGHDASALPIGRATSIRKTPSAVVADMVFAERPAAHPDAAEWVPDTVYDLFRQGVLNAFSVGFTIENARAANRKDIERHGDGVRRVVTQWKLLEFSVVTIPANQDALVTAVKDGLLDRRSFTYDMLSDGLAEPAGPITMRLASPRVLSIEKTKTLRLR